MKRLIPLLFLALLATIAAAQVSKTINVTTTGILGSLLTATEKTTVTNLTITGILDARDFVTMRDAMTILAVLDISTVNIAAYTGTAGTAGTSSQTYAAKELPMYSFYDPNGNTNTTLKTIILPNSVTSIGEGAFEECFELTSVTIPLSVTSIGMYAFEGCTRLTSITIPASVTSIEDDAFSYCTGFITVDAANLYYSSLDGVLYNKTQTLLIQCPISTSGSFIIPSSVTSIGGYAFESCSGLTSVTIPSSVTSIGDRVFWFCSGLTSVMIPSSVTSIGDGVFGACTGLTSVTIPSSVTFIGYGAFAACTGLTSVTIPSSVISIGDMAFSNCSQLSKVSIGKSVNSIGIYTFSGSYGLKEFVVEPENNNYYSLDGVLFNKNATILIQYPYAKQALYIIPNSVLEIGNNAFSSCANLTGISIPNSVLSIGINNFTYCPQLTKINIPNSIVFIGDYIGSGCSSLNEIQVQTNNQKYSSSDGILFDKNQTKLIKCPESKIGSYNIPNSVVNIGSASFYCCSGLISLSIPNTITSIGRNAFNGCSSLTTLTIPANVTSIGYSAFRSCSSLTSIYAYPTIPIDTISPYTFFDNVNKTLCVLYVPKGSKNAYNTTYEWKDFVNIVELTTGLRPISQSNIKIMTDNGKLIISNAEIGSTVQVFTVSGIKVKEQRVESIHTNILLISGMYLLRVGSYSDKVIVK